MPTMTSFALKLTFAMLAVARCVFGQTAPPSTDIFLVDVLKRGGQLALGTPTNITFRPGYDNQPLFTPDGKSLLFTSQREGEQTDIYRYDLATRFTAPITKTAESEYSPTVTPDEKSFSVIRVEADKTQRLWQFPLAGGTPALVLTNIKPVGYHVWLDANTLALFVLGQPNTLQLVDVKSEKAEVLAQSIGRALHRIPGQPSQFSFVHKAEKEWWVKAYDLKTRQTTNLIKTLPGSPSSEDCAWLPNGTLLMAQGSNIYKWQRGKDADWQLIADLEASGVTNITRLAVNAKGDKLALVAQPPAK